MSSAAAVDLDGDGKKEIVFGTKEGKVICIGEDSKQKWEYSIAHDMNTTESFFYDAEKIDSIPATPTIKDINNDGKPEIVFGTEMGTVYCLSNTGKLLWQFKGKGAVRSKILVEDIDNDGHHEVIFGSTDGTFMILDATGKERQRIDTKHPIESEPAVWRQNPTQVIVGTEKGALLSFNVNGDKLWEFTAKEAIRAKPSFGKLTEGENLIVGDNSGMLYCLDPKGNEVWKFSTGGAIYGRATIADVNSDENPEIVFGSCDNKVYCLSNRGERLWSYETDFWIVTAPIVTDIDGDGSLEVVVGSYDQNLYILDGEGAYNLDYMPGLAGVAHQAGHYSDVLTQEPGEQVGKRLWQIKTQGMIVGCEELEPDNIIVNVKTGFVDDITHTKE